MQERTLRLRAQEGEKRRLWRRVVEMYPLYEDYQRRTEGEIPICVP